MPKLSATKEEVKGQSAFPEGTYTFMLRGFKPKYSKDRGSVNLNPELKIINHPEFNDRQVFENLNTKAKWIWKDFCHAFGVPLVEAPNGDLEFPGDFAGPDDQPELWQYSGPLLGQTAQIYVVQADDTKGGIVNKVKSYACKLPNCQEKHSTNLAK
jgi:hypothetical protein